MAKRLTYKSAGVDIKEADVFVKSISGLVKKTMSPAAAQKHKAFGSLFDLSKLKYKNPVLVSSTDGVGTKLLIAKYVNKHDTVGIDLVAMNVNDVLCAGARPLFFLDYIACGEVRPRVLREVVKGIARGCQLAGCSLIGGETAEMPGLYSKDEYDLAGFAVGIAEKSRIIDGSRIQQGDVIIGLESSGLHSNGYSLVRKVFSFPEQRKLAKELLVPTRIYVKEVLPVLEKFNVHGVAHITGGAFYEKLTKIIPEGKCALIYKGSWPVPKIFSLVQEKGNVPEEDMYTTFNMGIGMALIVRPRDVEPVRSILASKKIASWKIGTIIKNTKEKIII